MNPILLTKLHPPKQTHTYVVRQRLLDQLNTGTRGKLNLIHAPAGYGKTTLALAWVATQQQQDSAFKTTWLTLEGLDSDPTRFLSYFIAAWQQIDPEIGIGVATALQSGQVNPQQVEPYELLNQLINELTRCSIPLALVLDDWHTIQNEMVQRIMQYWIEHVPSHIHTIITSREVPQFPLARWQLRGQLTIIDARALQFTAAEVGQFLREGVKLNLTDADIAQLTARSEGWIGSLQLMALSLQGSVDIETQLIQLTSSDRYLIAYLTDEVLSQQSDDVRQFITATVILNRFNAALCNAVTERNDSEVLLNEIEQQNLFVSALRSEGGWFRYHPLLSSTLRRQLSTTQPDLYQTYHSRAFTWLFSQGYVEEAIEHGLEAQRYHDVTQLLAGQVDDLSWCQSRAVSLIGWHKRLPEVMLANEPNVMLAFGWAITATMGFEALSRYLQRLRPVIADNLDSAEIRSALAILEAEVYLYRGEIDAAIAALVAVDLSRIPSRSVRGMGYQVQGYAHRINGQVQLAIDSLKTAQRYLDQPSDLAWWIIAGSDLAEAYMIQGKLNQSENICREIVASLPSEQHLTSPLLDLAWCSYGRIQFERNQLNEALDYIQRSLSISRAANRNLTITRAGLEMLARIRQAQGEWEDTLDLLTQIEALNAQQANPRAHFQMTTLRAHLHLLQQDHRAVTNWAARFSSERPYYVPRLQYHTVQLIYARWLLPGNPKAALDLLSDCQAQAVAEGWIENQLFGAILQAAANQRLAQTSRALEHLRVAIRLARPGGYIRTFVEQAVDLAPLLRDLAREEAVDPFIGAIQAAFLPVGAPIQPLIEPLTQRELEILRLIGDGLSNPQIAERLIVATGTVAYHTSNIFGKLNVRNRTEATLHARRLGLI